MINKSKIVKDAQKFVAKGQLDKAIAEYSKIVKASPNDTNTQNTIGDLYLKVGDKDKAIVAFRAAADVLNKDGFTLKAIALYKKVLNINPNQVDVQMMMGKLNAERGMLGNANENYLAAASHFTRQGKRDRALEVYKILCHLNPRNITLAQKLAELYMAEGMEAEGLSKLVDLAEIKLQDGDITEAKQFLEKARKRGSGRHDFMRVNSVINLKEGRIPEAVSELEELRKLDPNDARALTLLSDAYVHSGRYEEAASVIDDLLDEDPNNSDYRRKLISIFKKSGDFDAVWEQYRYMVEAHIDRKEYNKAQKIIQEYLELNTDSIEARQLLADMFTSIGRTDRVSELHAEMAEIYNRTGDYEKALNIYNKLLEKDPDNESYKLAVKNLGQVETPAAPVKRAAPAPEPLDSFPGLEENDDEDVAFHPGEDETAADESPGGFSEIEEPGDEEDVSHPGIHETAAFVPAPPDVFDSYDEAAAEEVPNGIGTGGFQEGLAEEAAYGEVSFDTGPELEEEQEPQADVGESIYDLSGMQDELPPLDLGPETVEDLLTGNETGSSAYEIDEQAIGDIGDLDMFGTESENLTEDTGAGYSPSPMDITALEPEEGMVSQTPAEEPSLQEGTSFEESITEADVYIKYGLYPKAHEILNALEYSHPEDPEIQLRFIEICKAQNDMDGFVERSLRLAGIYNGRGMKDEADSVLSRAAMLSPDDVRLKGGSDGPAIPTEGFSSHVEEEETAAEQEFEGSGLHASLAMETEELGLSPGSVGFLEELAEADFYSSQGLLDEARTIYRRLLAADPENDELRAKYNKLTDMELESQAQEEKGPVTAPGRSERGPAVMQESVVIDEELDEAFQEMDHADVEPADEHDLVAVEDLAAEETEPVSVEADESKDEDFFDLAAELRDEIGVDIISPSVQSSNLGDNKLDEVFQEFRRGVNEQLGNEDYETHYNLGIAYKEMGMIDEAITEFHEASKDTSRTLDCASMLGLCHLEKGEYGKALEHFKKGLAMPGRQKEEYFGLKYDMATAYELSGKPSQAFAAIAEIYKENPEFRDVGKRYERLAKSAKKTEPEDGAPGQDASKTRKSRVSYL